MRPKVKKLSYEPLAKQVTQELQSSGRLKEIALRLLFRFSDSHHVCK